jgi:prophage tail gpP-like protein
MYKEPTFFLERTQKETTHLMLIHTITFVYPPRQKKKQTKNESTLQLVHT